MNINIKVLNGLFNIMLHLVILTNVHKTCAMLNHLLYIDNPKNYISYVGLQNLPNCLI